MFHFICKASSGKWIPEDPSKRKLLDKITADAEQRGFKVKLSIEYLEKNVNEGQKALYRAFIQKASDKLGYEYHEMEKELQRFKPDKPLQRWSSRDLNDFIDKSSAFLAQYGFNF